MTATFTNKLEDGQPCGHAGCLNHVTHECEGCGRIAGIWVDHNLKCWQEYFQTVKSGLKKCEIRMNDRDFKIGNVLRLKEFVPIINAYTDDELLVRVTHITDWGQPDGQVVMSIEFY